MRTICLPAPGHEPLAQRLANLLTVEQGSVDTRRFPDGETYLRIASDVKNAQVVVCASLAAPDGQLASLIFLAQTARELGALSVGLVAPYLAYMRQDIRFKPGEAVSARLFAGLLSDTFDWLLTVDPHLHRIAALADVFRIPATRVPAAPFIASWIRTNIPSPVIIGPDVESEQWVREISSLADAPCLVLEKRRLGDHEVVVQGTLPDLSGKTPVLIDDIISSGQTMANTARLLLAAGASPPVCVAVHALFAPGATDALRMAGAARVVTCNTVQHATNAIDVLPGIAAELPAILKGIATTY